MAGWGRQRQQGWGWRLGQVLLRCPPAVVVVWQGRCGGRRKAWPRARAAVAGQALRPRTRVSVRGIRQVMFQALLY